MHKSSRREFLRRLGAGAAILPSINGHTSTLEFPDAIQAPATKPEQLASDEAYWQQVQQLFNVDRSIIHLNSGGVCTTPTAVQRSMQSHQAYAYRVPFYVNRRNIRPQIESIRQRLASSFGCEPEEIALTRNTSEGMEICQLGYPLKAGDEVLTTTHDYPRMINTWRQRERREGIVLKQVSLPIPLEHTQSIIEQLEEQITDRTRLIMISHIVDLTGQVMPVKEIVAFARRRGIDVLVDGAQAFGHLPFSNQDLDCDFYATSLHKWIMGPPGTGMLFVRKNHIESIWPLMPANAKLQHDIRKFEDIGTHPLSSLLAVSEALTFHETIGPERKEARLRYLRNYWAKELTAYDRVKCLTSNDPNFAAGLATIDIAGIPSKDLRDYLWNYHRIIVRPIDHPEVHGIRVSPGLHTTTHELDRFIDVMCKVIKYGIT